MSTLPTSFWVLVTLAAIAGVAALWLALRARGRMPKFALPRLGDWVQAGPLSRLYAAIAYLFTSREHRYRLPWTLILGTRATGKSSLMRSAKALLAYTPPTWEEKIELPGATWVQFEQGVLIDPEGQLFDVTAEKDRQILLARIDDLRPERPLDKIILTVSARSLMNAGEDGLMELARAARRQLQEVQHRFEFAWPVYLVVTQCDAVPGFAAFWRAQDAVRREEVFAWTAPPAMTGEAPATWVEAAFASLGERLRQITLKVAAGNEADQADPLELDRFFLFPQHFLRLQGPLSRWFAEVFQPSDWGQSFFCRGIHFTGGVAADGQQGDGPREDVDFLRGLLLERVFAEPHLAVPTRKRVWSRNRHIRTVQMAAVLGLASLLVFLVFSGIRLARDIAILDAAVRTLMEIPRAADPESCLPQREFNDILTRVAKIDTRSVYLAMPLSLLDDRATRQGAELISNTALEKVVMPAVSCRLARKARALLAETPLPPATDPIAGPRRVFIDTVAAVRRLEENLEDFELAARFGSSEDGRAYLQLFAGLAAYAYDQPLPAAVLNERGTLSAALARITFDARVQLPQGAKERYAQRIETLDRELRATQDRELVAGPALLAGLERGEADNDHLVWWLNWVRQSWLGTTATNNPCATIHTAVAAPLAALVQSHGYPQRLAGLAQAYGNETCWQPAMRTLAGLSVAPYGPMFSLQRGVLQINPALRADFAGLADAMNLGYMRLAAKRGFQCRADAPGWNPALLVEAVGYARAYLDFAQAHGLAAATPQPIYDRLARERLLAVLEDRLSAAQQVPAPSAEDSGVSEVSNAERRLARESADFAAAQAPLLEVLNLTRQLGFASSAQQATACAVAQSGDALRRAQTLADYSRLYDASQDGADLADLALARDWLDRQVKRARVLTGYASPYVAFMNNVADAASAADARSNRFWSDSVNELERYLQFKEPNGQVAYLHNLFLKTLAGPEATCRKRLVGYEAPEYGDDLFSQLRRSNFAQARDACYGSVDAAGFATWRRLADRFNRELAGRYPFGPLSAPDAPLGVVKAFFADYPAQRALIGDSFDGTRQAAARRFLGQMDATAAFFANTLMQEPASAPLQLTVEFNAQAKTSPGANQIVAWRLDNGSAAAALPNGGNRLDWAWGQPLQLDLTWASGSRWRPLADPLQSDLTVNGTTASYADAGAWSLLRLIQRHRAAVNPDPLDPGRVVLVFDLPTLAESAAAGQAARANARPHIALTLLAKDAKGAAGAVSLPLLPALAPALDHD